jgi:hypothetical protein
MAYVVKWLKPTGGLGQSIPQATASEALTFARTLAPRRPKRIWAEDDSGYQFQITFAASTQDD